MKINRSSVTYISRPIRSLPLVQKHIDSLDSYPLWRVKVPASSSKTHCPCEEVNDESVQHKCLQRSSTSAARDARARHTTDTRWQTHLAYLVRWVGQMLRSFKTPQKLHTIHAYIIIVVIVIYYLLHCDFLFVCFWLNCL